MERFEVTSQDSIEVKRLYIPLIIKVKCPTCNTLCELDFKENYLSYPFVNKPETVSVMCKVCEDYFNAKVVLKIAIELDETSIKPQ